MKLYIDLTNIINVNFITGIQRVVKEVVIRLMKDNRFELQLIALYPGQLQYFILDNTNVYKFFNGNIDSKKNLYTNKKVYFDKIQSGSIFFDIDSAWHNKVKRSDFLRVLKNHNVKIVVFIHDIIPIESPNYFTKTTLYNFMNYITAHLRYADLFYTSTEAVACKINELANKLGLPSKDYVTAVPGSDFLPSKQIDDNLVDEKVKKVACFKKYVLMVGTIEPRKNVELLLDAYDKNLFNEELCIILAGKYGWNVENTIRRIESHKDFNKKIFHFSNLNDQTIDYLYRNAFLTIFPSKNEGYGIPIAESLSRGVPIIAGDIPVLRENGGNFVDYVSIDSPDDLSNCILKYYGNNNLYNVKLNEIKSYKTITWDETVANIVSGLLKNNQPTFKHKKVKQIVFLSARPGAVLKTLKFVEAYMPFIKEVVVCCPKRLVKELYNNYQGNLSLHCLTDEEILGNNDAPEDAEARHFLLRCLALRFDVIDDEYLMFDDDYRPMTYIEEDVFYKDGSYQAYYFYDIQKWEYQVSSSKDSFSVGAINTLKFLKENNYPCLQYSAHMPQIINKNYYIQMLNEHPGIEYLGLCEWSSYFNFCIAKHPDEFCVKPYITLGWPGLITDWERIVIPDNFLFENYYPSAYIKDAIFDGFSEDFIEPSQMLKENIQKVVLAKREVEKHTMNLMLKHEFDMEYIKKYKVFPSITIISRNGNIELYTPFEMTLAQSSFNKIPINFFGDFDITDEGKTKLEWYFINNKNEKISNQRSWIFDDNREQIMIGVYTPFDKKECSLKIIYTNNKQQRIGIIPIRIV